MSKTGVTMAVYCSLGLVQDVQKEQLISLLVDDFTGRAAELVRVWHTTGRNNAPESGKDFNDNTGIVSITPSGFVYRLDMEFDLGVLAKLSTDEAVSFARKSTKAKAYDKLSSLIREDYEVGLHD